MAIMQYLTTTLFDHGALTSLARSVQKLGITRPLICTDNGLIQAGIVDQVVGNLADSETAVVFSEVPPNPTETSVVAAAMMYGKNGCDGIIALGGGSAMDHSKAVALLVTHDVPFGQYSLAEKGNRKIGRVCPLIAIPTTAGTGSEVSNAAMVSMDDERKLMFLSDHLTPQIAICDPDLTLGLPPLLTAATGMDAVTHCVEAVLSPLVNPPAEAVGLDGLERAIGAGHLERAVADGNDKDARWNMMMASTEGALAFVKGLGSVHAMSHSVGSNRTLNLHHGTLNAVILPYVLEFNSGHCGDKYDRLRQAMRLKSSADLSSFVFGLNERLGLPANLGEMGVTRNQIPSLVEHTLSDHTHTTNPRAATSGDYERLFDQAIG